MDDSDVLRDPSQQGCEAFQQYKEFESGDPADQDGDLDKPYSEKMEYLALVRDGSTGETKTKVYWLMDVLGADQ